MCGGGGGRGILTMVESGPDKDKGMPAPRRLLQPQRVVVAVCPLLLLRLRVLRVAQRLDLGQLRVCQDVATFAFAS